MGTSTTKKQKQTIINKAKYKHHISARNAKPDPVCVCVCQGLIKRQEGEISDSLELFQRAVTLNPNSSAAVKQVARSLYA